MRDKKASFGWTLFIIFLVLAIGYYLVSHDLFFRDRFIQTAENIDSNIQAVSDKANTLTCPAKILPEKILVYEAEGYAGTTEHLEYHNKIISEWEDGTDLYVARDPNNAYTSYYNMFGPDCRKGKNEGENANYLYCEGLVYNNSDQQISEDGIIGKTSKEVYTVILVLNSIEDEEWAVRGEGDNINKVKVYGNYSIVSSSCIKR